MVASQVFVRDTIVIVNISNPAPQRIEWLIAQSDSVIITEQSEHFAKVIFDHPGHYAVGIRTHSGECYQELFKTITAIPAEMQENDTFGESIIKNFTIAPNPNNGIFNADIELSSASAIRIRIINIGSGITVSDKKYPSQEEFSIPYQLILPTGTYIVLLETASGYMNLKMIVK